MINNLIKENLIDKNKKFQYSDIKILKTGKIGDIYQGIIEENKSLVLIIYINLFQLYKNENSINFGILKSIIENIKNINNNNIYNIYIEGNGINIVIKKYKLNFDEYYSKKIKN